MIPGKQRLTAVYYFFGQYQTTKNFECWSAFSKTAFFELVFISFLTSLVYNKEKKMHKSGGLGHIILAVKGAL